MKLSPYSTHPLPQPSLITYITSAPNSLYRMSSTDLIRNDFLGQSNVYVFKIDKFLKVK